MPPMSNKFAKHLPLQEELKHRLYLLDTDPMHMLQSFGAPQDLPKDIFGYNSVSTEDLAWHHECVKEGVREDCFTLG